MTEYGVARFLLLHATTHAATPCWQEHTHSGPFVEAHRAHTHVFAVSSHLPARCTSPGDQCGFPFYSCLDPLVLRQRLKSCIWPHLAAMLPALFPLLPYSLGSNASSFAAVALLVLPASSTLAVPLARAGVVPTTSSPTFPPCSCAHEQAHVQDTAEGHNIALW